MNKTAVNVKEALIKAVGIASNARKSVTESVVKRFNQRFLNIKKLCVQLLFLFSEDNYMFKKIRESYEHTIYASYTGYITQAIVNNFAPLLFLTFSAEYGLGLDKITLITTINFLVQLTVDLLSAKLIDRIGYRKCIMAAHIFAAMGIGGLAFLPDITEPYTGIMICAVLYAIGGGIIEVMISPIVEACPTEKKEAAMSLLHSFYCWGQVFLVAMSVLFFAVFGIENRRILALLWAIIPAANIFYFSLVPIYPITESGHSSVRAVLKQKKFYVFAVLMICAGASELAMSQWASAFAESALGLSKELGDLMGPCAFAVFMGTARALYGKFSDKISIEKAMYACAALCTLCYIIAAAAPSAVLSLIGCGLCGFSVGIFWPGTFSRAASDMPNGGTAMYALLALAGDLGCSGGPTLVGFAAEAAGGDLKSGLHPSNETVIKAVCASTSIICT